jgi:hypothetical protein
MERLEQLKNELGQLEQEQTYWQRIVNSGQFWLSLPRLVLVHSLLTLVIVLICIYSLDFLFPSRINSQVVSTGYPSLLTSTPVLSLLAILGIDFLLMKVRAYKDDDSSRFNFNFHLLHLMLSVLFFSLNEIFNLFTQQLLVIPITAILASFFSINWPSMFNKSASENLQLVNSYIEQLQSTIGQEESMQKKMSSEFQTRFTNIASRAYRTQIILGNRPASPEKDSLRQTLEGLIGYFEEEHPNYFKLNKLYQQDKWQDLEMLLWHIDNRLEFVEQKLSLSSQTNNNHQSHYKTDYGDYREYEDDYEADYGQANQQNKTKSNNTTSHLSGLEKAYDILGVKEGDDWEKIKTVYNSLIRMYQADEHNEVLKKADTETRQVFNRKRDEVMEAFKTIKKARNGS